MTIRGCGLRSLVDRPIFFYWQRAKVETAHINEDRRFRLYGTGHPIANVPQDASLHYIGTTQQSQMPTLVWHLFEEVKNG